MKFSLYLARQAADRGDFENALCNYFTVLKTVESDEKRDSDFANEFGQVLHKYLAQCDKIENAEKVWRPAMELFPRTASVFNIIGQHAYKIDCLCEARKFLTRAVACSSEKERVQSRMNLQNLTSILVDTWHFYMINDQSRNEKFMEAIEEAVKEDNLVLDIGSGTGILAMIAGRVAGRVIAIECNPSLYEISRQIVQKNDLFPKVLTFKHNSLEVKLTEKANVVISETLDCCVFGEGILTNFVDAHLRLSEPDAIFIPQEATLYLALIESDSIYAHHAMRVNGTEFRSRYVYKSANENDADPLGEPYWCCYLKDHPDVKILSDWKDLPSVRFADFENLQSIIDGYEGSHEFIATRKSTVHAILASFRTCLYGNAFIDTREETCWQNAIFPVSQPINVEEGSKVPVQWRLCSSLNRFEASVTNNELNFEVLPCADFYANNDEKAIEYLLSSIPPYCKRVCDVTTLIAFSNRLHALRPDIALSITQFDETQIPHYTADNAFIAPDLNFSPDLIVHWPIAGDGTLNGSAIEHFTSLRVYSPTARVIPAFCAARATLVNSDWLNTRTRLVPSAHLKFDLSVFADYTLQEYRDISSDNFPHTELSNEFELSSIDFNVTLNVQKKKLPRFVKSSTLVRVTATDTGLVDGILYYWRVDSSYTTKERKMAAFVLPKRIHVEKGDTIEIRVDLHHGSLLIEANNMRNPNEIAVAEQVNNDVDMVPV